MNESYIHITSAESFPGCLLKKPAEEQEADSIEPSTEEEKDVKKEKALICRACGNVITKPEAFMNIQGKSTHTFVNPAGVVYKVGCFSYAKGCAVMGEPTREFTWFPGYSWNYALCSNCLTHLGWYYTSGDTNFYGLIMDNIAENEG